MGDTSRESWLASYPFHRIRYVCVTTVPCMLEFFNFVFVVSVRFSLVDQKTRLDEELVTAVKVSAGEFVDLVHFLVCRFTDGVLCAHMQCFGLFF